ncbi:hypothetical protein IMCC12053_1801 [Celeribacter marinus]|uniref:Uncharacterized protein n=1 Tax=Celeribacter marinus TaxID=1397108 RepID=A0A0P0A597_9RHOB|nr:hypothetical protein IMCC12053_1801 [Celeribacter marinus]
MKKEVATNSLCATTMPVKSVSIYEGRLRGHVASFAGFEHFKK